MADLHTVIDKFLTENHNAAALVHSPDWDVDVTWAVPTPEDIRNNRCRFDITFTPR